MGICIVNAILQKLIPVSKNAIKQKQEDDKKIAKIKKTIINNCLVKQYDHNNNDNDELQDTKFYNEINLDWIKNVNIK